MVSVNSSDSATDWRHDLDADLAERGFDRHAGLDADQQQIERIGKCAPDRELALRDRVLQEQHRRLQSEIGRGDAHADLHRHRFFHVRDHEHIQHRPDEEQDRRHQPEEQERDVRRVPAIAGHDQLFARGFLGQPFAEVEVLHHLGDQLLRRLAQRHLFGPGETLALALADPLAFAGDRLHALGQTFAGKQRHDQRIGGRAHGDSGEQHGHEPRVVELVDQELNHAAPSEVEIDHFLHHDDADGHPASRSRPASIGRSDGSTAARCNPGSRGRPAASRSAATNR